MQNFVTKADLDEKLQVILREIKKSQSKRPRDDVSDQEEEEVDLYLSAVVKRPDRWRSFIAAADSESATQSRHYQLISEIHSEFFSFNATGPTRNRMGAFFYEQRHLSQLISVLLDPTFSDDSARLESLFSLITRRAQLCRVARMKGVDIAASVDRQLTAKRDEDSELEDHVNFAIAQRKSKPLKKFKPEESDEKKKEAAAAAAATKKTKFVPKTSTALGAQKPEATNE